jgi:DNA-directed RNA polymerase subunit RPC12/RpoP
MKLKRGEYVTHIATGQPATIEKIESHAITVKHRFGLIKRYSRTDFHKRFKRTIVGRMNVYQSLSEEVRSLCEAESFKVYKCDSCGKKKQIKTNHKGPVTDHCPNCSWKANLPTLGHKHSKQFSYVTDSPIANYLFDE